MDKDTFGGLTRKLDTRNLELRVRAKPKDALITVVDCIVISVAGYVTGTSFTPRSELRIGGQSSHYSGGDSSRLEIAVQSETPIERITCRGLLPIEKGDTLRVYVLKAKEEFEQHLLLGCHGHSRTQKHYLEREFNKTETALKIEKIRNGEVVATYHT